MAMHMYNICTCMLICICVYTEAFLTAKFPCVIFRPKLRQLQRPYLAVVMGGIFRFHARLDSQPVKCRHWQWLQSKTKAHKTGNICITNPCASILRHFYAWKIQLRYCTVHMLLHSLAFHYHFIVDIFISFDSFHFFYSLPSHH